MRMRLVALLSVAIANFSNGQDCIPYYETSMNASVSYTPYFTLSVPELPNDNVPGGVFAFGRTPSQLHALRWNDQIWETSFSATGWFVSGFVLHDEDGEGPLPRAIYAGTSGRILRWDGITTSDVTNGLEGVLIALGSWDEDGSGPWPAALYAHRTNSSLISSVAKWDGQAWTPMPFPSDWRTPTIIGYEFLGFDPDGTGPEPERLYLGGSFYSINSGRGHIARWTGSAWELVGGGFIRNANGALIDLDIFDMDGDGPASPVLVVASDIGPPSLLAGILSWNGLSWTDYPEYRGGRIYCMQSFDIDGLGPEPEKLYLADDSFRLHTYNGSSFVDLGRSFDGNPAFTMKSTNLGGSPALICGGPSPWRAFGVPVRAFAAIIGCPRECSMDIDASGGVDLQDLAILLTNFGTAGGMTHENGDVDGDEDVDLQDLASVLADFGMSCT